MLTVLAALVMGAVLAMAPPAEAVTATTTTLVSSANPATAGQAITLTATVTGAAPSGQVIFGDSGVSLGTVDLNAGVATLVVSSLPVGDHALEVLYLGDADNDSSIGALTQRVVAVPAPPPVPPVVIVKPPKPPTVTLVASTTKASVGDKVQLRWHSKRATVVMASGDWAGEQKSKGSATVRIAERGKHVFKLTVQNASGAKTATVKVLATRKAKELELLVTDEPTVVGSKVDIKADGLAAAEPFTLRLNGAVIMTGKADEKGDVVRTFQVAKTTPEGALPLTLTGSNPDRVGTAILNVIAPKTLDVTLNLAEVKKRDEQTVIVTGLLPGEQVTLSLLGKVLTKGKASSTGSFTYTFRATKPLGEQTITAVGVIPGRTGKATFTVLDPGRGPNNGG